MGDNNQGQPAGQPGPNEQQKMVAAIGAMSEQIFNMMSPGATFVLNIPGSNILTPGRPRKVGGQLIVTKPAVFNQLGKKG